MTQVQILNDAVCISLHANTLGTIAQSAEAVEYTNCISAEGYDALNECPVYDTKQYDGEVPVLLIFWLM